MTIKVNMVDVTPNEAAKLMLLDGMYRVLDTMPENVVDFLDDMTTRENAAVREQLLKQIERFEKNMGMEKICLKTEVS